MRRSEQQSGQIKSRQRAGKERVKSSRGARAESVQLQIRAKPGACSLERGLRIGTAQTDGHKQSACRCKKTNGR